MNTHKFSASTFDAIAAVLSSERLHPFRPSPQIFELGDASTFGIRKDYRARRVADASHPLRHSGVQLIATEIAHALGVDVVDITDVRGERFDRVDEVSAAMPPNAVIVCDDMLQRVDDPTVIFARLRLLADKGALIVVSTTLRAQSDNLGPPQDPSIARQWTFPELQACLDGAGLEPLFGGVLPGELTAEQGLVIACARLMT